MDESPSMESGQFNLSISENGLKSLTEEKILYTSKFHKIQWTCDPNYELPIKMANGVGPGSETPITLSQAFLIQHARLKNQLCMQYLMDPPSTPTITDDIAMSENPLDKAIQQQA